MIKKGKGSLQRGEVEEGMESAVERGGGRKKVGILYYREGGGGSMTRCLQRNLRRYSVFYFVGGRYAREY